LAGFLSEAAYLRVIQLIDKLGFPLFVPELNSNIDQTDHPNSIVRGLEEFREHLGGKLTIMLIDEIGHGFEVHEMDNKLIVKAIKQLEEMFSSRVSTVSNK
jgi:3-dehydroquinate synthase